jgi:hypothetical protein
MSIADRINELRWAIRWGTEPKRAYRRTNVLEKPRGADVRLGEVSYCQCRLKVPGVAELTLVLFVVLGRHLQAVHLL